MLTHGKLWFNNQFENKESKKRKKKTIRRTKNHQIEESVISNIGKQQGKIKYEKR